jgi:hypothetical protein
MAKDPRLGFRKPRNNDPNYNSSPNPLNTSLQAGYTACVDPNG